MSSHWMSHPYLSNAVDQLNSMTITEQFEFDESDIWNTNETIHTRETKKPIFGPRAARKPVKKEVQEPGISRSLPLNVPNWSKILQEEYREHTRYNEDDECEGYDRDGDGNDKIPPHEYLARTRVASSSVHEGLGRTLKGRDLSRVRNAVLKKIGFED